MGLPKIGQYIGTVHECAQSPPLFLGQGCVPDDELKRQMPRQARHLRLERNHPESLRLYLIEVAVVLDDRLLGERILNDV